MSPTVQDALKQVDAIRAKALSSINSKAQASGLVPKSDPTVMSAVKSLDEAAALLSSAYMDLPVSDADNADNDDVLGYEVMVYSDQAQYAKTLSDAKDYANKALDAWSGYGNLGQMDLSAKVETDKVMLDKISAYVGALSADAPTWAMPETPTSAKSTVPWLLLIGAAAVALVATRKKR